MHMTYKKKAYLVAGLCLYYCLYFIASVFRSYFLANVLSPIAALSAAGLVFRNYKISFGKRETKPIWLTFGIACGFWAISDILHLVYGFNLSVLYVMTNVFFATGIFFFIKAQGKRFRNMQLLIDALAFSASAILLIWELFFNKNLQTLEEVVRSHLLFSFSLGFDFIMLAGIFIWSVSLCRHRPDPALVLLMLGNTLYFFSCICHLYLYYKKWGSSVPLLNCAYNASFILTAIGACLFNGSVLIFPAAQTDSNKAQTIGMIRYRFLFLLLFPAVVFIVKGFSFDIFFQYGVIVGLYLSFMLSIRTSIKNQHLLHKEKELNASLEEQVAQRTKELIEKNKELDFISNQDALTNLYNRRYFMNVLDRTIQYNNPTETVALLFMDLDRFKSINDTYGHLVGDQVLLEIAGRLKHWCSGNSILARLGGDEFVFLFTGQLYYVQMKALAQSIIESCNQKIEIGEYVFHVTMSIGISIYPLDAQLSEELIRNADIAMYYAKAQGTNQCITYNYMLETKSKRRTEIEMLLKRADYDSEFTVYYQPQFSVPDNKLVGMEALLRWNPPGKQPISPSEFIPISEEINCIVPIGEWVMKKAVKQIATWNKRYGTNLKMGINVSPKQLDSISFFSELENAIKMNEVIPQWLDFEITESFAIEGLYHIMEISSMFNDLGVSISIDDFGTGYSSLSYLKSFPFDRIKIAKTLIDAIAERGYDMNITKSIILLADSIGVKTIAEGVESKEQLGILEELGCEEIQGFLFSKPLPSALFEDTYLKQAESMK